MKIDLSSFFPSKRHLFLQIEQDATIKNIKYYTALIIKWKLK